MIKKVKHSYRGINQDISKSKLPNEYYFDAKNIRIVATNKSSTYSVTNEKGNEHIITIPSPAITVQGTITYNATNLIYTNSEIDTTYFVGGNYLVSGTQKIIATCTVRNNIIIFSTDGNGFDCIWKLNDTTFNLTLLYLRDLEFSTNNPIQILNNFENDIIDKIYWVDGVQQLRFINLEHSIVNGDLENLIDLPVSTINMVGEYTLSEPIITGISNGGTHTAGMIQYAYNLYKINGSQTKISPLSTLVSLDKDSLGGGKLNELVGKIPIVSISNIDESYTNIRVYSVKYTTYNDVPIISLIDDREIPSNNNIEIFDDGTAISSISLEEFLFLGSDIIIPKHISSKFNRLFLANYKEINFEVGIDTRAYSYNSSNIAKVYDNLFLNAGVPDGELFTINVDADYDLIPARHDSVNLDYKLFRYQKDGLTTGGEGKYLKYELTRTSTFNADSRYFKDNEIYRIGIIFYNNYGQTTIPKWVADFKTDQGNLQGSYGTLKVSLKPEFFTWLSTTTFDTKYDKPVGFKIVLAERGVNDRTIIANGLVSSMMVDHKTSGEEGSISVAVSDTLLKLPNFLARNNNTTDLAGGESRPLRPPTHLLQMNINTGTFDTEFQRAPDLTGRFGLLYQYNSMMQLYSPEILFGETVQIPDGSKFRAIATIVNNVNNTWGKTFDLDNGSLVYDSKALGGVSPYYADSTTGDIRTFEYGLVSHPQDTDPNRVSHTMHYREYTNDVTTNVQYNIPITGNVVHYDIYGKPETTEVGQGGTNYNNDTKYRYVNSLESVLTDGNTSFANDGKYNRSIVTMQSYNNRCITFVLGDDNVATASDTRPRLEGLFGDGTFGPVFPSYNPNKDVGIIGEFVKSDVEIYLGNIYGGNSYEDKLRTKYIEIGTFKELNSLAPTLDILSPGDTFVNDFKFTRIVRKDTIVMDQGYFVSEEIINFTTETTIDLKNRSDISLNPAWDSRFQPLNDEYHNYNKIYSQLPSLIAQQDFSYTFKKLNNFNTNIISSKLKTSGELIDSWTDLLVNEYLTLDGKHGAINSLINFKDEIYAIQDNAFAYISISPRVQTQGSDGITLQLGTGQVLDRYQYISTDNGTLNKWSTVSTSNAIYFYSLLNKCISIFKGSVQNVTDGKGLHTYFINNTIDGDLKQDNPLINKGISTTYDYVNDDVLFTFHQGIKSFTVSFNEKTDSFTSFYDYKPSLYSSKGNLLLSTNTNLTSLYRHGTGLYNNFYNTNYPSYITLLVNPESDLDCVFNNIEYKSEVYINDIDQPVDTLSKLQLWNEYQDSGIVPLILHSNLSRKFRDWRATLPRQNASRDRIRNPWVYLKLQFDNTTNKQLILHDVIISYTV